MALAVLIAGGVVAVNSVIALYAGSFLPGSVIAMVGAFWMAAAAVAAVVIAGILSPVLFLIKGRGRLVLLPGAALAAGFAAASHLARLTLAGSDSLGGALLFNQIFLGAWGVLLATVTALVARKLDGRGAWAIWTVAAAAIFVSPGLAFYVRADTAAFVLVMAPVVAIAFAGAAIERSRSAFGRAHVVAFFTAAMAAGLAAMAAAKGELAPGPIERGPRAGSVAPAPHGKPNVVVIVVDTMRAEETSLCGYGEPTTPNLESLAKDCLFFPYGESVDSCTLPAHASLFTGKYPREHGARADLKRWVTTLERYQPYFVPLAPSQTTLATRLAAAGWATGGVAGNYARLCRQFGVDQGFQYYHDMPRMLIFTPGGAPLFDYGMDAVDRILGRNGKLLQTYWDAGTVTNLATDWVEKNSRGPFFLFINYMDPHYPYSAAPPYDHIDGPDIPYNMILRQGAWQNLTGMYLKIGKGLTPELIRQARNQYHGELAYTDHWLGELVERLKAGGLYDNTLIVVTADHGEFFGEHSFIDHGLGLYEEGTRIPILVKYPRQAHAGEVNRTRVSIIDIFATVLDVCGLPVGNVTAQPLGTATHPVIAENYENADRVRRYGDKAKRTLTVICDGDLKYTRSTAGTVELYNLANDPTEAHNLAESDTANAARLGAELDAWFARTPIFDGTVEMKARPLRKKPPRTAAGTISQD